jgi:hypothetical protein
MYNVQHEIIVDQRIIASKKRGHGKSLVIPRELETAIGELKQKLQAQAPGGSGPRRAEGYTGPSPPPSDGRSPVSGPPSLEEAEPRRSHRLKIAAKPAVQPGEVVLTTKTQSKAKAKKKTKKKRGPAEGSEKGSPPPPPAPPALPGPPVSVPPAPSPPPAPAAVPPSDGTAAMGRLYNSFMQQRFLGAEAVNKTEAELIILSEGEFCPILCAALNRAVDPPRMALQDLNIQELDQLAQSIRSTRSQLGQQADVSACMGWQLIIAEWRVLQRQWQLLRSAEESPTWTTAGLAALAESKVTARTVQSLQRVDRVGRYLLVYKCLQLVISPRTFTHMYDLCGQIQKVEDIAAAGSADAMILLTSFTSRQAIKHNEGMTVQDFIEADKLQQRAHANTFNAFYHAVRDKQKQNGLIREVVLELLQTTDNRLSRTLYEALPPSLKYATKPGWHIEEKRQRATTLTQLTKANWGGRNHNWCGEFVETELTLAMHAAGALCAAPSILGERQAPGEARNFYGCYARRNFRPGEQIAIYTGRLQRAETDSEYFVELKGLPKGMGCEAACIGDETRFMNTISGDRCNVVAAWMLDLTNGRPTLVLSAGPSGIAAGEEMFWDYGPKFRVSYALLAGSQP